MPGESACYRCLFPEPPPPGLVPNCQEAGILGAVAGVIGVIQANEVLKFVLGAGKLLTGRLLVFNALDSSFRKVKVPKDPRCPICGENPSIKKLIDYVEFCSLRKKEG
jgi:adenylyltransferase/sulfurtransferase